MYANYELVLLEGTCGEGNLSHKMSDKICEFYTFDSDTLQIQLNILAESYISFRQGEGGDTVHNIIDFLKITKRSGPSCQRSCPWSGLFWLCQQQMPALKAPSVH